MCARHLVRGITRPERYRLDAPWSRWYRRPCGAWDPREAASGHDCRGRCPTGSRKRNRLRRQLELPRRSAGWLSEVLRCPRFVACTDAFDPHQRHDSGPFGVGITLPYDEFRWRFEALPQLSIPDFSRHVHSRPRRAAPGGSCRLAGDLLADSGRQQTEIAPLVATGERADSRPRWPDRDSGPGRPFGHRAPPRYRAGRSGHA